MNKHFFTTILATLFLTACATGGSQPDWINGTSNKYSQARYLSATGSAAQPEDAKRRALANLTKVFEVKIEETSRDESSAWRNTNEAGTAQGTSQLAVRYIDAYTSKLLEGANIAETWINKKQNRHYALAVISRSQLSTKLRGDIAQADRYVQRRVANANQLQDPILKAQTLYSARSALHSREMLQKDLQIVDRTGAGVPTKWSSETLDARINAALSKAKVSASAAEDGLGELDRLLQSAITAASMRYVADAADYQLQGKLDVQDVGMQDGWYWYRGSLRVDLIKTSTGKVSAAAQWPLKSSAQTQKQSLIRLKDEVARILNTQLKSALLSFTVDKEKSGK